MPHQNGPVDATFVCACACVVCCGWVNVVWVRAKTKRGKQLKQPHPPPRRSALLPSPLPHVLPYPVHTPTGALPAPLHNNNQEALLHSIVARLQEPPFCHDLAAKPPHSLLQLLYHVLSYLEPRAFDIKNVPENERVARTLDFLGMLNCPFLLVPDDAQEEEAEEEAVLAQGLREGNKAILLPLMAWCLDNLPYLHRRAYLGRYLMPVDIHSLQLEDPIRIDLHSRLRGLQAEFTSTHKAFEEARANLGPTTDPRKIRAKIKQLEEEKQQLEEKIGRMARVGQREVGFEEMLSLTRAIREEEEEEGLLSEKLVQERQALEVIEGRVRALGLMVEEKEGRTRGGERKGGRTRTSEIRDGATAEVVVEELQEEVRRLQHRVTEVLPLEMERVHLRIGGEGGRHGNQQQQQQQQQQLKVGKEDVEALLYEVKRAELHVQYWKAKIEEKIISAGMSNLTSTMSNLTSTTKRREGGKEGGKEGGREGDRFLILREQALVAAMARRGREEELKVLLLQKQQQQQLGGGGGGGGGAAAAAAATARRRQEEEIERLCEERRVLEEKRERLQRQVSDWADFDSYRERAAAASAAAGAAATAAVAAAPGGMTSRGRTGITGSAAASGGGGRSTQSELEEALRQINKEIKLEKVRLQPLVKVLKEGRREGGVLEEEHCLRKAQYERVMMMARRGEGGREGREGGREGGREMLALKALLEVKLRVCEEGRSGEGGGRGATAAVQQQQQY